MLLAPRVRDGGMAAASHVEAGGHPCAESMHEVSACSRGGMPAPPAGGGAEAGDRLYRRRWRKTCMAARRTTRACAWLRRPGGTCACTREPPGAGGACRTKRTSMHSSPHSSCTPDLPSAVPHPMWPHTQRTHACSLKQPALVCRSCGAPGSVRDALKRACAIRATSQDRSMPLLHAAGEAAGLCRGCWLR